MRKDFPPGAAQASRTSHTIVPRLNPPSARKAGQVLYPESALRCNQAALRVAPPSFNTRKRPELPARPSLQAPSSQPNRHRLHHARYSRRCTGRALRYFGQPSRDIVLGITGTPTRDQPLRMIVSLPVSQLLWRSHTPKNCVHQSLRSTDTHGATQLNCLMNDCMRFGTPKKFFKRPDTQNCANRDIQRF